MGGTTIQSYLLISDSALSENACDQAFASSSRPTKPSIAATSEKLST